MGWQNYLMCSCGYSCVQNGSLFMTIGDLGCCPDCGRPVPSTGSPWLSTAMNGWKWVTRRWVKGGRWYLPWTRKKGHWETKDE